MKTSRWLGTVLGLGVGLVSGCSTSPVDRTPREPANAAAAAWPGMRRDGRVQLPNQWLLDPVGRQVKLGDFPVNIAVHPGSRFAAVLHSGYGTHEVVIVEVTRGRVVSRVELDESFYGVAFNADGSRLYVSGAGTEMVMEFAFRDGFLQEERRWALRTEQERGIPSGVAVTPDGRRLWVANLLGQSVSELDLERPGSKPGEVILGAAGTPGKTDGEDAWKDVDDEAITKRARALLETLNREAPYPYACAIDAARGRLYVSFWGQASVGVIDLATRRPLSRWVTEEHPNEMLLTASGRYLYVANANRNTVSVLDTETGRTVETLTAELTPGAPPGSTPNSLAITPDESLLFVANANINALAVFDVHEVGKSKPLGFIPTGWYPTSVRVTPDGRRLLVANGKGVGSRANRNGPQPGLAAPATLTEYIGGLFQGSLAILDLSSREKFEEQLAGYTARANACQPAKPPLVLEPGHPVPLIRGQASPIKYCLYIVKENRTYDQVLGDLPQGNGDPSICLFPEEVTPNHHQLARDFVLLDNFYVESEVSADGHEWSMGAYATDFVEKIWPLSYGHNQRRKYAYPAEGRFKIAEPAGGYLWDRARAAGVTYRSYGEFVNNPVSTNEPCSTLVEALQGHFDPWFRSFDMDYSDQLRADRFIAELARFEREGEMPRLQILRLPNDHTSGTSRGKLTPTAQVADNDLAFGRVVEAVSKSRFWSQTAIFVVEDDAQNGPDHVDAHRTIAYVISPYVKRRTVDSTLYSTASMLRTMELILGLEPMSQFDAAAMPMLACFGAKPDLTPYRALPARVDLTARNPEGAWGYDLSEQMNFAREDAADDLLLNEVIWRSVRGPEWAMPAPVRAGFVRRAQGAEEDEDEDED